MTNLPPHIFRAYDIRGIAEKEISEEFCKLVGRGFGSELCERYKKKHPTVIVGRDARTHGPKLESALIEGLVSSGCIVKTIGQTPSPVNYFALCHFECDGSVQITASHNPKEDNGLKLQIRCAEAFAGEELQKLLHRIEEGRFVEEKGLVEKLDAITPYKEKIASLTTVLHNIPLTVVADFGNGVAGPVYGKILKESGVNLIELYADPDGTFPNHPADPSKHETLTELINKIKEVNADCGIAFDGDGDRIGIVDERGNIVSPDYLLLLLAEDHLKRNPKSTIVYTVSMSSILETEIKSIGGMSIMCEVGHSFVEHTMHEHGSHLGGEQSGHFFCGEDYYDFDDALVAAIRILSVFEKHQNQQTNKQINQLFFSELFSTFPKIFQTPEWRPNCPDNKKNEVINRVTKHFKREGYPCNTIDGVRIDFGDGAWAGIRMSNTSPKISVCMEARSKEKLREIEGIIHTNLSEYTEIEK